MIILILFVCSAFESYSVSESQIDAERIIITKKTQSYYVNCLGDRVDSNNPSLRGCCYLVKETQGGRTCQKINF
jgi:hypothetical protein